MREIQAKSSAKLSLYRVAYRYAPQFLPTGAVLSLSAVVCNSGFAVLSEAAKHLSIFLGLSIGLACFVVAFRRIDVRYASCVILYLTSILVLHFRSTEAANFLLIYWQFSSLACFSVGWSLTRTGTAGTHWIGVWMCLLFLLISSGIYLVSADKALEDSAKRRVAVAESQHPVGVAYAFGAAASICTAFAVTASSANTRAFAVLCLLFAMMCLVTAGSRGGIIAYAVVALSIVPPTVISWAKSSTRFVSRFLGSAVAMSGIVAFLANRYTEQIAFIYGRLSSHGSSDASTLERYEIWDQYWAKADQWLLLGIEDYYGMPYPHNFFFELAVRFGVLGILASLAIVGLVIYNYVCYVKRPTSFVYAISSATGIFALANAQFNLSLDMNRVLFFGVGAAIGSLASNQKIRTRKKS